MEIKVEGNETIIKVILGDGVPSHSKKTLVVATTGGYQFEFVKDVLELRISVLDVID